MKKSILILIYLTLVISGLFSQSIITLEECQLKAKNNYPLIKQYALIEHAAKYTIDNISKNYLPQVSFNAQASYQSDVTKTLIDLPIPTQPKTMDKDQYKATIDVAQLIWDGGVTKSSKRLEQANTEVEIKKTDISLYSVRKHINQLYFGILLIDEQIKILKLLEQDLQTNLDLSLSMFRNGIAIESDVDQIKVELLNLQQNYIELNTVKKGYLQMLSLFINEQLPEPAILEKPKVNANFSQPIERLELALYEKQRTTLDIQQSLITAKNMPKLSLFAQCGYGKPGLNMLESQFRFFAIGGIKLNWNFSGLYTKENERKLVKNNQNLLNVQEETFRFNTNLQLNQAETEIQKYKQLITNDDEIIQLRERVKKASESKYKNGVYQINDLIRDINSANQALSNKVLHEIHYLQSIYDYNHIQGD